MDQIDHYHFIIQIDMGRYIPDLCALDHADGCEPYDLDDPEHVPWVGSVLHRSCIAHHNGSLGATADDLDDLSADDMYRSYVRRVVSHSAR